MKLMNPSWFYFVILSIVFCPSLALAAESRIFFASAVSYCSEARAIVVEKFLLEYDANSNSISFDISAQSVETNLSASLQFNLVAYGINAVNESISLCDTLSGILCPLPTYDFVGSATIPLPLSVASKINIPSIGYIIPDLEATAYVRLISVSDGQEAACLKVDLSNGRTTRHGYVSWALGGIALLSLTVGIVGGAVNMWKGVPGSVEEGRRKERLVTYIGFLQFVATTGLLSLEYPILFESFTANFAWALGLIYERRVQQAIDGTRQSTGGNLTQVAGNLVGGTAALNSNLFKREEMDWTEVDFLDALKRSFVPVANLAKRASSDVTVPDVQDVNSLDSVGIGIPRFSTNLNISPYNFFLTVFINFLFFLAIFLIALIVLAVPFFLLDRRARTRPVVDAEGVRRFTRSTLVNLVRANALRILLICWFPILISTFFQWTIGSSDSWAPIVLSVFTVISTTAALLFLSVHTALIARREGPENLLIRAGAYAPFWNSYKVNRWWFFGQILWMTFLRSLFISFARSRGWSQTTGLLTIEVLVFISQVVFLPYEDRSSNGTNITFQILRIIISGALIPFNSSIGLNEIVR
ncbi:hypothetical protein T439DRAFT_184535 [Meredithblackwellia eburnea MCA 4105]